MKSRNRGILLIFLAALLVPISVTSARTLDDFRQQYDSLRESYVRDLQALSADLRNRGRSDAADTVETHLKLIQSDTLKSQPLAVKVRDPLPAVIPAERVWEQQLRRLQEAQAVAIYKLAQDAINDGEVSFAYRSMRIAVRLNSDYEPVRRMLGYVRVEDKWLTPFEEDKQRRGEIWDDRFGWIAKDDLPKYEQGLRPIGSRWVPALQERELRTDFRAAWEVRTEHWLVKTNHSLEKGVEIARKLEDYYQFFITEFPGLFNNRVQMKKMLGGDANRRPRINLNPFVVHYYKNKQDYVDTLVRRIPRIAMTNGLYQQHDRVSYFFFDQKAQDESAIYHEATHQILFESRTNRRDVAEEMHFWVIEGFACYMESYQNDDGEITLGDPLSIRFDNARDRLIRDKVYFPLSQFTSLGMERFQAQPNIAILYSQSSGLVHFFLHANDGKYRDSFIEFLAELYSARRADHVPTLEKLTGLSYPQLDKEYILYIQRQAEEIVLAEQDRVTIENEPSD